MHADTEHSFKARALAALRHELKEYGVVSLYLYLYFVMLQLYKVSILKEYGIAYAPFGLAAIKALIIGKFVLVGQAVNIGHLSRGKALIWHLVHQVVMFVVFLLVLNSIEEVIVSLLHHRSLHDALAKLATESWQQVVASALLGGLALTPFFGYREIARAMGTENFRRMMFAKRL